MTSVKISRSPLAWMLLAIILANLYACTLEHGRHVGFRLALGDPALCLSTADPGADVGQPPLAGGPLSHQMPYDCPLCSAGLLVVALLLCLGWLGRAARSRPQPAGVLPRSPRAHWPSLNPRAP